MTTVLHAQIVNNEVIVRGTLRGRAQVLVEQSESALCQLTDNLLKILDSQSLL